MPTKLDKFQTNSQLMAIQLKKNISQYVSTGITTIFMKKAEKNELHRFHKNSKSGFFLLFFA